MVDSCVAACTGSSPRGRGKLAIVAGLVTVGGLIPARAGKTRRRRAGRRLREAHPRAGGENHARKVAKPGDKGSSPRGRGKHLQATVSLLERRLIPARAGKTLTVITLTAWKRAHPRAGGENDLAVNGNFDGNGSSPRGRGKRALQS